MTCGSVDGREELIRKLENREYGIHLVWRGRVFHVHVHSFPRKGSLDYIDTMSF